MPEPQAPTLPSSPDQEIVEPVDPDPDPVEPVDPAEPVDDGSTVTSEPDPDPGSIELVCYPECPQGTTCIEGRCFVACDPTDEHCEAVLVEPESQPESESEVAPLTDDLIEAEAEAEAEPAAELLGPGLRIAPIVSACLGSGCRDIRIGSASGAMGVGGGLDLRLTYRATPHLSIEAGGLGSIHGNDLESDPTATWFAGLVGPRLHLSGGRWRAEPVVGLQLAYVRSLVRWSNAGSGADGLGFGADVGISMKVNSRVSIGMLSGIMVPYWTRVCDADNGVKQCYGRSELSSTDLHRLFWTTSLALVARF